MAHGKTDKNHTVVLPRFRGMKAREGLEPDRGFGNIEQDARARGTLDRSRAPGPMKRRPCSAVEGLRTLRKSPKAGQPICSGTAAGKLESKPSAWLSCRPSRNG